MGNIVPRVIWSYWNEATLPADVQVCVNSWSKYNPEYTIRLLNAETAKSWLGYDPLTLRMADSVQRVSDIVRLEVVAKHGGVWLDASFLLTAPLSKWVSPTGFTGFTLEFSPGRPVYESWAFAAPAGDPFVTALRDEFLGIEGYASVNDWLQIAKQAYDLTGVPESMQHYLAIHCCAEIVRARLFGVGAMHRLYSAGDTAFKWLTPYGWDPVRAAAHLPSNPKPWFALKFRGPDRSAAANWLNSLMKS
jgi:hypothetical protein